MSPVGERSRAVVQVVRPEPVIEGAGVHLRRSIGTRRLDHLVRYPPAAADDHAGIVNVQGVPQLVTMKRRQDRCDLPPLQEVTRRDNVAEIVQPRIVVVLNLRIG